MTLRWKAACVLAVVLGMSFLAFYPPLADHFGLASPGFLRERRLVLGLDLRGGVQFALKVNVDERLLAERTITREEIVEHARRAVDRRINELGVTEPVVLVRGAQGDEIVVQLPGYTDVARARRVLGTTARLEWRLVEAGPALGPGELIAGIEPNQTEIVEAAPPAPNAGEASPPHYFRLSRNVALSGREIRNARASHDGNGLPVIAFSLTPEGARIFADVTAGNIGRRLAIVVDGKVHSAPTIENAIPGGEGVIQGAFTLREASDLALAIRSGALPASMTWLGGEFVGPSLGLESMRAGGIAAVVSLGLVAGFVLIYYRRAGMNAVWSIIANLLVLLGALAMLGSAVTLPGIAGVILTIGMGVDSNVLIFERIKEELRRGHPPRRAVRLGFDRVFLTILDTHVASLIAAAFLFHFGSGTVRGFATTLTIGLLSNVFTAVVISRTLFELALSKHDVRSVAEGRSRAESLALPGLRSRRRVTAVIDVMSCRKYAFVASTALVTASMALIIMRGMPLGLDFTGGTSIVARFASAIAPDVVRQAIPGDDVVQQFGAVADQTLLIRVPPSGTETAGDVETGVERVTSALTAAQVPAFEIRSSEVVGPAISRDMRAKSTLAAVASLSGITAYLAARFRPSFAAAAFVATAHDLVITVAMLGAAGYDLTLTTVAAILTVAGYSVNDTIVIFDRVRENLRTVGAVAIATAVNDAVHQTIGRTVITAGTTFLSVIALFVFGGDSLRGFAFAMLVGVVAGTYSTVFIAAPMAAHLSERHFR